MREIKFRAWHKEKKIMASVGDWNWTGKVHVSYKSGPEKAGYFFGGNNVGDDWEKDEYELMQYTGLKDKNGKEIYEGDIVHCSIDGDNVGNIDSINFKDGSFWLRYRDRSCASWIEFGNELEVIGNIYETPNLLNS